MNSTLEEVFANLTELSGEYYSYFAWKMNLREFVRKTNPGTFTYKPKD